MFTIDYAKTPVTDFYGINCFTEAEMGKYISDPIIRQLKEVQRGQREMNEELADYIASAMKQWALNRGATHFCHWFQPLTGLTAEKHDSFISPTKGGKVLLEFSGKELIKGEGDASSFPNGGLRETFEARGYTAWDTSSPAFLKEVHGIKTLYIPTAFFSYKGEALDKKVPLLRSNQAIEKQALRVLRALGNTTAKRITVNIGPEQEYFLVDRKYYEQRTDLRLAGRTVIGSLGAKSQEQNDHYYGTIGDRVAVFMSELNYELWKLGISSKTQHKESAPNQFEIAVVYDAANLSTDHNQLLMDVLQMVALRHGMVALLHEKPFAGVNGSGKHDNWSLATEDGTNLYAPGTNVEDNVQFLIFLTSFIKAMDEYAPLIRSGAATAGNDLRLGSSEAPPAVISIYLGDQLTTILETLSKEGNCEKRVREVVKMGTTILPELPKDLTDRNRTSPIAFTGNKFEYRMVGSSQSMAGPNIFINAAVAQVLGEAADRLEAATDKEAESHKIISDFYQNHKRIIFNGNGYSEEWAKEAKKRGLPHYRDTVSALPQMASEKSLALLEGQEVLSRGETLSRLEIYLEGYSKQINVEASTMIEMCRKEIIPAMITYLGTLSEAIWKQEALNLDVTKQKDLLTLLNESLVKTMEGADLLHQAVTAAKQIQENPLAQAKAYRDTVVTRMEELRTHVDLMEIHTDKHIWPIPSYDDLLFRL
ncbi:MAG TPA: glutamine synthetase III [Sphaerochaeta sp.]|nr:glutamine synthetase III [Spirochaetota bacterium]TAH56421.1 MAG: glutamine synthetase type III [Sphaerochaeta sp.]HPK64617.1 glutamine synthetase III [Sphaerochaeta sp.]HPY45750.1 glutamine synthetase III [Sphaerochaeta sp.]HQB05612.1 glutamine synthetase III [Sphaerochaeta sp.]